MYRKYDNDDLTITEIWIPDGTTDIWNGNKRPLYIAWYKGYFIGSWCHYGEALNYGYEYIEQCKKRNRRW